MDEFAHRIRREMTQSDLDLFLDNFMKQNPGFDREEVKVATLKVLAKVVKESLIKQNTG